ncbi:hypothetical protein [Flavobacterium sp.]|uniref:hypothetical protein n=1 Tax=Flavobacterium sp. TaxID=239 RepID=UPI003753D49A
MKKVLIFLLLSFTIRGFSQYSREIKMNHHNIIVKNVVEYSFLETAADYLSSDIKIIYNYNRFYFRLSMRNFFNIYADEPSFNFDNLRGNGSVNFNRININKEVPVYLKWKITYKF